MKIYDKLVRDLIPEVIEKNGQTCVYRQLSNEEFLAYAEKKLDEELLEYHSDKTVEELADLLEVVYAIVEAKGVSLEKFEEIRLKKLEKRGGFSKKLLLESVEG